MIVPIGHHQLTHTEPSQPLRLVEHRIGPGAVLVSGDTRAGDGVNLVVGDHADAVVAGVADEDLALAANRQTPRVVERGLQRRSVGVALLPGAGGGRHTAGGDTADTLTAQRPTGSPLRDVDRPVGAQGQAHRVVELGGRHRAVLVALVLATDPGHRGDLTRGDLTDAVVLGVNLEEISLENLRRFVDDQFISYPVLRSVPRRQTEVGPIPGMPTTYLISPSGEAVARQIGGITRRVLEDFLARQRDTGWKGDGAQ